MSFAGDPSCSPLEYDNPNLTLYVHTQLGDRCVAPSIVMPTAIVYGVILFLGVIGNVCTCVVIAKNKTLQNPTNYYLFSLAVSDLLMLVVGLPLELYGVFDVLYPYEFGEFVCKLRAFLIEFTSYASILTIVCFSLERWLAICFVYENLHYSSFDRSVKVIIAVWLFSFLAASPVAFIVVLNRLPIPAEYASSELWLYEISDDGVTLRNTDYCAMDSNRPIAQRNFILYSFIIFFMLPAFLIICAYSHIMWKLGGRAMVRTHKNILAATATAESHKVRTRRSLLKVLVAVVVMFFLSWLPFHIQRLLTIFLNSETEESLGDGDGEGEGGTPLPSSSAVHSIFSAVFYISGYCFYSNSCINPLLYNLLSQKYRMAFCKTILGERLTRKLWAGGAYQSTFRCHNPTTQLQQQERFRSPSTTAPPLTPVPREARRKFVSLLQQPTSSGVLPEKERRRLLQSTKSHPFGASIVMGEVATGDGSVNPEEGEASPVISCRRKLADAKGWICPPPAMIAVVVASSNGGEVDTPTASIIDISDGGGGNGGGGEKERPTT